MITYEGLIILSLACALGFALSQAGLYFLKQVVAGQFQQMGLQNLPLSDVLQIIGLVLAMIILSIAFAIYPILKMNISTILSNEK